MPLLISGNLLYYRIKQVGNKKLTFSLKSSHVASVSEKATHPKQKQQKIQNKHQSIQESKQPSKNMFRHSFVSQMYHNRVNPSQSHRIVSGSQLSNNSKLCISYTICQVLSLSITVSQV